METSTLLEFGIAGILAGITFKALDVVQLVLTNYYAAKKNGSKPGAAAGDPTGIQDLLATNPGRWGEISLQLAEISQKLGEIIRRVARLERVVIDGDGARDPLTTQIALVCQDLDTHKKDKGLHTQER